MDEIFSVKDTSIKLLKIASWLMLMNYPKKKKKMALIHQRIIMFLMIKEIKMETVGILRLLLLLPGLKRTSIF